MLSNGTKTSVRGSNSGCLGSGGADTRGVKSALPSAAEVEEGVGATAGEEEREGMRDGRGCKGWGLG